MLVGTQIVIDCIDKRFQDIENQIATQGANAQNETIKAFRDGYITGLKACLFDVQRLAEETPIEIPSVHLSTSEKTVTIYCDDMLYNFVLDLAKKGGQGIDFNFIQMGKLYNQLKNMMDKAKVDKK